MKDYPINSTTYWEALRLKCVEFAYVLLCLRGCLSWLGINTFAFTLLLNLILLISIDYRRITKEYLIVVFFVALIPFNRSAISNVDLILMALLLRPFPVKKVASIYLGVLLCFLVLWLILYYSGFLETKELYTDKKGTFNTYGFNNANGLGMFGFHIGACFFLILGRKNYLVSLILILAINQIFYGLSASRTPWMGGILFALCILLKVVGLLGYKSRNLISFLPILLTLICYYFYYNFAEFFLFDVFLSGRLSLIGGMMQKMTPINWLIGYNWDSEIPLDGSYILLLFSGGILFVILFWTIFYKAVKFHYYRLSAYIPFILAMLACGCGENTFSECTGLSVVFWSLLMLGLKSSERKKRKHVFKNRLSYGERHS